MVFRRAHSSLLALVAALPLTVGTLSPIQAAALDTAQTLQLPPQRLSSSLIDLGKRSGLSIVFPSPLVLHQQAPALKGEISPRQALEKLLEQTPLTYREISPRVVAIVPRPPETGGEEENHVYPVEYFEEMMVIGRSVTGSRINRSDLEGSSPVDIISAPELARSGSQSLGEFLKFVPAVSGNSTSTAVSNGGDGTATVTLRGLPANNTLVLINGQRVAFDGQAGDSVDLNSIPPAAVERIEILKDGASAIYGSDAIAGVVNIVMRTDYDGLQLEQYYGESSRGDLETLTSNLLWGTTGERGGLLLSATYYSQNGLYSRDRSLSANADGRPRGGVDQRVSATETSRITLPDEQVLILDEQYRNLPEGGSQIGHYREATDEDLFNYQTQTSSISPSHRYSLFVSGHYELNDKLELTAEGSYSKTRATISLASTPLYTAFEEIPLPVSADNPYNPFGTDLDDVRRRILELPAREQENESQSYRFNIGLEGSDGNLHWDSHLYWSRSEADETISNLLDGLRVAQALGPDCRGTAIDGCEPLNLFGPPGSISAEQLAYITRDARLDGYSQLYGANLIVDTMATQLDAGPVFFAAGIDVRRERSSLSPRNYSANDELIGGISIGSTRGERDIAEIFFEVQLPLLANAPGVYSLDLELAARHSHYSDFGDNTSPKLGLRYRPVRDLLLRATFSEGFRAPSLDELHKGGFRTQAFLEDPCSIEANVGVLSGCSQQSDPTRIQYLTEFSGDAELSPEESTSYSLGLVWTPLDWSNLSLSLDYFQIKQRNVVDSSPQTILDENAELGNFGELVQRDANGNITKLFAPFINIGAREIQGLDLAMRYQVPLPQGNLVFSLNASHIAEFLSRVTDQSETKDLAGTFTDDAKEGHGAIPEWKLNGGLVWSRDDFELSYSLNYVSSLREDIPFSDDSRSIDNWITHDLQFNYRPNLVRGLQVSLGADNLLDEQPPFAASAFNDNYDARTYDIKGRFWYLRLSQSF
jgi:iron complex outermembrane receptor protein